MSEITKKADNVYPKKSSTVELIEKNQSFILTPEEQALLRIRNILTDNINIPHLHYVNARPKNSQNLPTYSATELMKPAHYIVLKRKVDRFYKFNFDTQIDPFIGTGVYHYLAKILKEYKEEDGYKVESRMSLRWVRGRDACFITACPDLYIRRYKMIVDFKISEHIDDNNDAHELQLNLYAKVLHGFEEPVQSIYNIFLSRKEGFVPIKRKLWEKEKIDQWIHDKLSDIQVLLALYKKDVKKFYENIDYETFQTLLWVMGEDVKIFGLDQEIQDEHLEKLCDEYKEMNIEIAKLKDKADAKRDLIMEMMKKHEKIVTVGKNRIAKISSKDYQIIDTQLIKENQEKIEKLLGKNITNYFRRKEYCRVI